MYEEGDQGRGPVGEMGEQAAPLHGSRTTTPPGATRRSLRPDHGSTPEHLVSAETSSGLPVGALFGVLAVGHGCLLLPGSPRRWTSTLSNHFM